MVNQHTRNVLDFTVTVYLSQCFEHIIPFFHGPLLPPAGGYYAAANF